MKNKPMFKTIFEFTSNSLGEIARAFFWLMVTIPFVMIFTVIMTAYVRLLWEIVRRVWVLF